jgi:hypothetical protein
VNIGEMKTAVKRHGFDDTDPIYTWIVAAIHEFERYTRWPFLRNRAFPSTIVGDNLVTVSSEGFSRVGTVRYREEALVLSPVSPEAFEEDIDLIDQVGKPSKWLIYSDTQIQLWPVPDDVYVLSIRFYDKIVVPGDSELSAVAIPETFHYNIVQMAAAFGLDAENNEDRAATLRSEAISGFDSGISSFYGTTGMFSQVRDTQGYEL